MYTKAMFPKIFGKISNIDHKSGKVGNPDLEILLIIYDLLFIRFMRKYFHLRRK